MPKSGPKDRLGVPRMDADVFFIRNYIRAKVSFWLCGMIELNCIGLPGERQALHRKVGEQMAHAQK